MNTFFNYDNINSLIDNIPEMSKSFNEIINGLKEYIEYMEKVKSKITGNESIEEMMKIKEKEYDKLKEILEKRKGLRNKGEEAKGKIEEIKKIIDEICNSCDSDETNMMKANNEIINEMNVLEEKIKSYKMKEIMDKIEEMIKEMIGIEEKSKKRYLEREQERIKPTEYKEENKEEYIKYCQEICELEEEDNNRRKAIINKIEKKEKYEEYKIIEEMKRKEEEKKKKEEEERKRKEEIIKKYEERLSNNSHIIDNISKLEEWSGSKFNQVLYNSAKDGKTSDVFRNKIMNHSKLYFIVIDENDNVFGHYHPSLINKNGSNVTKNYLYDENIFMFSLYSNGRSGIERFKNIGDDKVHTFIWGDSDFYHCHNCKDDGYWCSNCNCEIYNKITERFSVKDKKIFTGGEPNSNGNIEFKWKEIIVVEMK